MHEDEPLYFIFITRYLSCHRVLDLMRANKRHVSECHKIKDGRWWDS